MLVTGTIDGKPPQVIPNGGAVKDFRFIYSQSADGVFNYVSDIQPQVKTE